VGGVGGWVGVWVGGWVGGWGDLCQGYVKAM
jgi:hypothetical protein